MKGKRRNVRSSTVSQETVLDENLGVPSLLSGGRHSLHLSAAPTRPRQGATLGSSYRSVRRDPRSASSTAASTASGILTTILVMSETLPLAEIKAHLSEIVDRIEREHERILLTRHGRPAAVIMSPDDLASLEDTLELLSDPEGRAEIEAGRQDIAEGRTVTGEDLLAKYLRR